MIKHEPFSPKIPSNVSIKSQNWHFVVSHEGDEVAVEVKRWADWEGKGKWNYYLFVPVSKLKDKDKWVPKYNESNPSWSQFDYSESDFNKLDFHGGVTYCIIKSIGNYQTIQVGCDYAHIFDSDDMDSEHESVFADAYSTGLAFLECKPYIEPKGF